MDSRYLFVGIDNVVGWKELVKAMKCKFNCFECPYEDCISDLEPEGKTKKRGRKRLPPEVLKEHRHMYYEEHKAEHRAYCKEYNKRNADRVREKQREWRDRHGATQGRPITIWVTNGTENRRTLLSRLEEYEARGWYRGRS